MCGIVGIISQDEDYHVSQLLVDALTVLQHRGQDAAGIVTSEQNRFSLRKENGLVAEVFQQHHMERLRGNMGLGHVRYPTAGSSSCAEAQPLYTNFPYGICVAHNGNLINTKDIKRSLTREMRHINTDSDSELLLNVFAQELMMRRDSHIEADGVFDAVSSLMTRCTGAYGVVMMINNVGLLGFRDPNGIRPIVFGARNRPKERRGSEDSTSSWVSNHNQAADKLVEEKSMNQKNNVEIGLKEKKEYIFASESVAIDALGFDLIRDVRAGEAILIDKYGEVHTRICHPAARLTPCMFEYVYFARPDSILDGVQVYQARLNMGKALAEKILRERVNHEIDVVIPVPDTSRTSALQCANTLGVPYREGFIKNRYIARTFIMPGQEIREKTVRMKLNPIKSEFKDRNVLLVDDSIVRGTTSKELVCLARNAGAKKVFFVSAAPAVKYPNVYGIDIPTYSELIAYNNDEKTIAKQLRADWVMYQDINDMEESVSSINPKITAFDSSCFNGQYCTGYIDENYLQQLGKARMLTKSKSVRSTLSRTDSSSSVRSLSSKLETMNTNQSSGAFSSLLYKEESSTAYEENTIGLSVEDNDVMMRNNDSSCDGLFNNL